MSTTIGMVFFSVFLLFLIGVSVFSAKKNKEGTSSADKEYFLGGGYDTFNCISRILLRICC